MNCPYCKLPLNNGWWCESNETHKFYCEEDITGNSWYLVDSEKKIQIGKSISHPYYYMLLDSPGDNNIFLLEYVSPENCVEILNKIYKLKSFI